jgi:hypothetical protein
VALHGHRQAHGGGGAGEHDMQPSAVVVGSSCGTSSCGSSCGSNSCCDSDSSNFSSRNSSIIIYMIMKFLMIKRNRNRTNFIIGLLRVMVFSIFLQKTHRNRKHRKEINLKPYQYDQSSRGS